MSASARSSSCSRPSRSASSAELAQLGVDVRLARAPHGLAAEARDGAVGLALQREQRVQEKQLAPIQAPQGQAHRVDDERLVGDQDLDAGASRPVTAGVADAHANLAGQTQRREGRSVDGQLVQRVGPAAAQLRGVERRLELGAHERVEGLVLGIHRRGSHRHGARAASSEAASDTRRR